jgi:hypothetical protein
LANEEANVIACCSHIPTSIKRCGKWSSNSDKPVPNFIAAVMAKIFLSRLATSTRALPAMSE